MFHQTPTPDSWTVYRLPTLARLSRFFDRLKWSVLVLLFTEAICKGTKGMIDWFF